MEKQEMISVDHVSIRFNLSSEKFDSFKEYVIKSIKGQVSITPFWALKDVSFKVYKGESLGLIGLNGSGKSTMLKTIAGVLKPTEGSVTVRGSVAPLIELGAGFDMDLTARENVFLNGALLGYSRTEMEQHYNDIVEFSELQNFMEVPVKNFSSGMVSRLAFAIATIGTPDILIVDEVLSVGDFQFQEKCMRRIQAMMDQGTTMLFVSHSIEQVERQVKNLNKALKQAKFGTDQYQFKIDRNPDYADYYDMIMAPELMEGDGGLFTLPFQQKYGNLVETLFSQIAMSDDTQVNARKQSELQQNIERFTDFRTYLKFDLETTDQNGSRQLLSQTLNTKSGGETQTPFYIAVLASFAQLYQVNNSSTLASNTVRLVVFDEAFNKMDSDRIIESIRLLRKMGLQAIICTPPDKLPDIMPLADRTHLVIKERYQMRVKAWGKEIMPG